MTAAQIPQLLAFAGLGLILGACYFLLLRRSVDLLTCGGAAVRAVPLFLGRIGAAAAVFWAAAQAGAGPLLAAAGGFLAARAAILALARRRR